MSKIFISHERNDQKFVLSFKEKVLQNFNVWSMSDIRAGDNFEEKIEINIEESTSAILILTPEFFSSSYIMDKELPLLLEREKEENFKIIPLLLRDCKDSDLKKLGTIQIFPSTSRPIGTLERDEESFYLRKFVNTELAHENQKLNFVSTKWKNIVKTFNQGTEVTHRMRGDRGLVLYAGPSTELKLMIPIGDSEEVDTDLRLRSMELNVSNTSLGRYLIISCLKETLNQTFFMFCELIDDLYVQKEAELLTEPNPPRFAEVTNLVLKEVTQHWRQLTSKESTRANQEKGLLGELWFLKKIVSEIGKEGLNAWRGPDLDRQDFRLGKYEFEIKTTSSSERSHFISSITQLEPSPDFSLYLISIQISPSKTQDSISIASMVLDIEKILKSPDYIDLFHTKLKTYMDVSSIESLLKMRSEYILSSDPMYMEVDESFPKLSHEEVQNLTHKDKISDISYRLNVEGLGSSCNTQEFTDFLTKGVQ